MSKAKTIKSDKCYCHDSAIGKCVICQETEDRQKEDEVCSSWNWNGTARECAMEAKDLGWTTHTIESAMTRFGYKQSDIKSVVYEFENLDY